MRAPSDPDFERRVRASFGAQRAMDEIGATLHLVEPGRVELRLDHRDRFTQQHGFLHAGILAAAMDSACGYAALSLMPSEAAVLTVEFKINLLRPADAGSYRIDGDVIRSGRTITVAQATASVDGQDEPIAVMTASLMALVDAGISN